ncbi:histone demethlylase [Naegleria gruberi]|uniref:Histone demethlylase n=1 Tax=Naegleria gruberi TaxID=5762 RepID=D2VIN6_NAEGR|nr:histone demethlylase [Naegleria gruberi]EFC43305.1 histone demethlylase [Naegleria gruberi]|eukprot:XP_002676049.1 histone demethlylase [Naegleria gruberi strain NEG-M]
MFDPSDMSNIPLAGTVYPTEEEFKNPIEYLESVRHLGEKYGILKIVPPEKYKLDPAEDFDDLQVKANAFKFICKIQNINQLQFRNKKQKLEFENNIKSEVDESSSLENSLKRKAENLSDSPQKRLKDNSDKSFKPIITSMGGDDSFGFERTKKEISLKKYKEMADEFSRRHLKSIQKQLSPSSPEEKRLKTCENAKSSTNSSNLDMTSLSDDEIEKEYWRIVNNHEETVTVQYGNDLPVSDYQTFFPASWKQGWDANLLPKLPDSLLSFLNIDIPGVNTPMLYVGMLFSSFCWHVEDHFMYAMNFIHHGAPKQWYGIPASGADKFEEVFRRMFPNLMDGQPAILHMLVTQISPAILAREGVPVYRIVHEPGTFIITFPRAYHAGFNQGFNIAESVNFTSTSWLPYNRLALSKYYECKRATTFPYEHLILSAVTSIISGKSNPSTSKYTFSTRESLKDELSYISKDEKELRECLAALLTDKTPRQMPQISNRNIEKLRTCSKKDNNIRCCQCNSDCYISAAVLKGRKKEDNFCLRCAIEKAKESEDFAKKCYMIERMTLKDLEILIEKFEKVLA